MSSIRVLFLGLAMLLPTTWTVAKAADEAPAEAKPADAKKEKKTKKGKKAEKTDKDAEKKAE